MTALGVCSAGLVTLHLVMGPVLAAHPERVRADVDGYIAPLHCGTLGQRYVLLMGGKRFEVSAADCATWQAPAVWPLKRAPGGELRPWLGDVDSGLWQAAGVPMAPAPAILCEVAP